MTTVTGSCPYYSTTTYATCGIPACPGDTISVSGCNACSGQQKLTLYSGSTMLTGNYGSCTSDFSAANVCSAFIYEVPNTYPCQTFTLREQSNWSGSQSTGTVSYIVSPYQAPTVQPTAPPTIAPSPALPVYFEMYNTSACNTKLPELRGFMQSGGDCFHLYEDEEDVTSMITCASTSLDSAWTFTSYANNNCAGTPISTVTGSGTCTCTEATAVNSTAFLYINCAGDFSNHCAVAPPPVNPTSNGGSGSSDSATTGIIVGVVVGVVALGAIVVSVAAYYGMFKCTKPLAKSPQTEMNSKL